MQRPSPLNYFKHGPGDPNRDRPYDYIEDLDNYVDFLEKRNRKLSNTYLARYGLMVIFVMCILVLFATYIKLKS